ncbi:putative 8-amino-7-oxononanoate synthase [Hypsizygus marmoreus]|uniref:8-amino-7-oxononanoate synthase n=1 Tax=Hypsizygus marmoreus TaxID=39966 RepID=A0A369K3P6_HYPMA|nr:putative 8-amino-7-oxononanoate synthase [Hypsizygus marmoreus]
MKDSALTTKLNAALVSRDERKIRRRLPDPNTSSSNSTLIDFNSNDYLSLSTSELLRKRFLKKLNDAPDILGSGGSRLLVNGRAHSALEERLANFFGSETALLFNSGFDANVGFFSCIPQSGDVVVYDEYIHASVHDGIRASRSRDAQYSFLHNSIPSLRQVLTKLRHERPGLVSGTNSLFIAVESLYSMDGTFAPLSEIVDLLEMTFPNGNGYLVVDEAHATGIYGPQGRGRVAQLGLETKVLARLHTFGKALAATGAVILTSTLIRDYLLNYARSLIYTTSLSFSNIVAADCSFDLLVDGTAQQLAADLLDVSSYFVNYIQPRLASIPPTLLSLPAHLAENSTDVPPSPIIPIMTSQPRPLSAYLLALGMNARPITWPTVPKGKDRVRVCLHAGNTRADVEKLAQGAIRWAEEIMADQRMGRTPPESRGQTGDVVFLQSKL